MDHWHHVVLVYLLATGYLGTRGYRQPKRRRTILWRSQRTR